MQIFVKTHTGKTITLKAENQMYAFFTITPPQVHELSMNFPWTFHELHMDSMRPLPPKKVIWIWLDGVQVDFIRSPLGLLGVQMDSM